MGWLDLHLHSNCSDDGEFTPGELMEICARGGVRTAALADHNTVRGIKEAGARAALLGLTLIPAVELDCVWQGINLHLLGYWIDPECAGFARVEQDILSQEQAAARERVRLVSALGIHVELSDALALSHSGVVTGEMIAETALSRPENEENALLAPYRPGGARADNPFVSFYWDFCAQGKPAYVPIRYLSLPEAVGLIHEAGGIAVLAHPGSNLPAGDRAILREIAEQGVSGLEAYSSYHTGAQTAFYLEQAAALRLAVTCGSDFHGKIKPGIKAGSVDCAGQEAALLAALAGAGNRTEGAGCSV